jgi:predicted transcriptional regulator YheO
MLRELADELHGPPGALDRAAKQAAGRLLDERGAITLRRSIEDVADALGVSRVTVDNDLEAIRQR